MSAPIIKELEKDKLYTINGVEVYKDTDGKWISRGYLNKVELGAFAACRALDLLNID